LLAELNGRYLAETFREVKTWPNLELIRFLVVIRIISIWIEGFLRAKAATVLARLRHHNSVRLSVRPSVRHTCGSVKNGASYRITKSSPSAAWKTLYSFRNRKAFL